MNIKSVVTYNDLVYESFGKIFNENHQRYCNNELLIYNEDGDFFDKVPELKTFLDETKNIEIPSIKERGQRTELRDPKEFRFYYKRFCYKVFAYTHAILNENCDGILFFDADIEFSSMISTLWLISNVYDKDSICSYFGRKPYRPATSSNFSETGILYFNLRHPQTKEFAKEMKRMYTSKDIFKENEWHDGYIFDVVRRRFEREGHKFYNLSNDPTLFSPMEDSVFKDKVFHNMGIIKYSEEYEFK